MKIAILSGKGGAGKTTVATNLALSLPGVQLLDADVEEPNAHLFLNPHFGNHLEPVTRNVPQIDPKKCILCGRCVEFCEFNALALLGNRVIVYPEACHSCGGCKEICNVNAISGVERQVGVLRRDQDISGIEFWQGELSVGEESSIPVIRALLKKINRRKIAIIDAPPGTACSAVEVASDSDFCLLVAEPTPFGLHDLQMTVDVIEQLEKPWGIVINRSDSKGDQALEDYAKNKRIPIFLKIPFERSIAEFYAQGIPFVEKDPSWKHRFQKLIKQILAYCGET